MSVYCSQCGAAAATDAKFCSKCGSEIPQAVVSDRADDAGFAKSVEMSSEALSQKLNVATQSKSPEQAFDNLVNGDKLRMLLDSKIGTSKWWPIFASFTFFLCAAIIQNKRQYSNTAVTERIFLVIIVTLFYTSIAALYFARTKKTGPLTPWEAEARSAAFRWYVFVAVLLSLSLSLVQFSATSGWGDAATSMVMLLLLVAILAAGWFAWHGRIWAYVALFLWEVGSAVIFSAIDPFGLFIVVFCVQAYRYHRATKQLAALDISDFLGLFSGMTRLAYAATRSQGYYIKSLLKSGANVNERTATGFTPLMLAAATNKSSAVVKQLIKAGADKAIELPDGRRAVDFARERGAAKLVPLLTV